MRKIVFGSAFLLLVACSDPGHVTTAGQSIYTQSVQKLVLENRGGGFVPPVPPTAACDPQISKYTLVVAGRELAWQYCDFHGTGDSATYEPKSGSRTLTDSEWTGLQPTLSALVVDEGKTCGADKPTLALIVTTGAGDLEYGDGFYGCQTHDKPLITSDGLSGAEQAFYDLARK